MRAQPFNRGARLLVLGALIVLGCKKPAPPPAQETAAPAPAAPTGVAVASIQLGSQIGADKSVTAPKSTFTPRDTIYAVVSTTGVATDASLEAMWTYVGTQGEADQPGIAVDLTHRPGAERISPLQGNTLAGGEIPRGHSAERSRRPEPRTSR